MKESKAYRAMRTACEHRLSSVARIALATTNCCLCLATPPKPESLIAAFDWASHERIVVLHIRHDVGIQAETLSRYSNPLQSLFGLRAALAAARKSG